LFVTINCVTFVFQLFSHALREGCNNVKGTTVVVQVILFLDQITRKALQVLVSPFTSSIFIHGNHATVPQTVPVGRVLTGQCLRHDVLGHGRDQTMCLRRTGVELRLPDETVGAPIISVFHAIIIETDWSASVFRSVPVCWLQRRHVNRETTEKTPISLLQTRFPEATATTTVKFPHKARIKIYRACCALSVKCNSVITVKFTAGLFVWACDNKRLQFLLGKSASRNRALS
jgi:hypothetical protein